MLTQLPNIVNEQRRTETELQREFEDCKADILGGFLDVLAKALAIYPSVKINGRLFRMADFTRWGAAISKALGFTEDDFLTSYGEKVKAQTEEAAYASPVATTLIAFIENRQSWEGTATELYSALLVTAKSLELNTRQKGWPKAPHAMVRHLNELIPSLKSLGIEVEYDRTGATRRIGIKSVTSVNTVTSVTEFLNRLRSEFQSGHGNKVLSIEPLEPITRGVCTLCKKTDVALVWQIQLIDETRFDGVCVDCGGAVQDLIREFQEAGQ
jgi:hypothetical protein